MLDKIYDDVFQCVLRTLDEEGKFNLTLYGTRYLDTLTSLDHILFLTKNLLYDTEDRMRLKALNFKRSLRNNKTMGRE